MSRLLDGRIFKMIKFRTMVRDAEKVLSETELRVEELLAAGGTAPLEEEGA